MKDEIVIRDAKPEDVLGINTVLYKAWLETYPNEEAGVTPEDIEDSYKDHFTEESILKRQESMRRVPANQKRVVAASGNAIVGAATMIRKESFNQLMTMYVLPEFHGKGIGRLLWDGVKGFRDPTKKTIAQVAVYNARAIRFYEKLGFVDNGRRFVDERFKFKSGSSIPEMELEMKAEADAC